MRVEQRADDVLNDYDEPDRRPCPAASKQEQMCAPHGKQERGADKPKLDRDCEYLIVRIGRNQRRGAGITDHRAAELFADRSRAVTEHRRVGDQYYRFPPELQPFTSAGARPGGLIVADLIDDRRDALTKERRGLPYQGGRYDGQGQQGGEGGTPAEPQATEEHEKDRYRDHRRATG